MYVRSLRTHIKPPPYMYAINQKMRFNFYKLYEVASSGNIIMYTCYKSAVVNVNT